MTQNIGELAVQLQYTFSVDKTRCKESEYNDSPIFYFQQ